MANYQLTKSKVMVYHILHSISAPLGQLVSGFYAQKQLLLSLRLSDCNSVCLSICLSVCHMGGSVKNSASKDYQIFTVGCLEDCSFKIHKAFP